MKKVLVVVDMQNDFVSGALGSADAEAIVDKVADKIKTFDGDVYFTLDTHGNDYLNTAEGRKLPVPHCIKGSRGFDLCDKIKAVARGTIIEKPTFGSIELCKKLEESNKAEKIDEVEVVGLCTDICVLANAVLIKSALYESEITVCASCCAGSSPSAHAVALEAMRGLQININ